MTRWQRLIVLSITILAVCVAVPGFSTRAASQNNPIPFPSAEGKKTATKVGQDLRSLYQDFTAFSRGHNPQSFTPHSPWMPAAGEWVTIDALASDDGHKLLDDLQKLGLQQGASAGRTVSGRLPITAIPALETLKSLHSALPAYAITNVGLVDSQGDAAMRADIARSTYSVDGTGTLIGTLSDSYDCQGGAATDVSNGDLPSGIQVLQDEPGCSSGSDEGRGMMQLIADVAPGADQAFHTAYGGQAGFAQGILDLATAGADIIVDDVVYLAEPFFQDGVIAQAVDSVVTGGVAYFSSAGNAGRDSFEDNFRNSGDTGPYGGPFHDFNSSIFQDDPYQQVTIPIGTAVTFSFQWEDPYSSAGGSGADTDLDIYLLNSALTQVVAYSNYDNIDGDPVEVFDYYNLGPGTTFYIAIEHYTGPTPDLIKYVIFASGGSISINEYDTQSSTVFGHANAAGAEAVGAAFYGDTPAFGQSPPLLESFSSAGPTPILFNLSGSPITPIFREKPEIVAPDGGNTTFFGQDIPDDADSYPNFFGTSAAAPHAAAVAALLLESSPTLSPAEIYAALETTAIDMDTAGFDDDTGHGLIQADAALAAAASAELSITKTVALTHEPAWRGDPITYTVVVANSGTADAENVTITDTLPEHVEGTDLDTSTTIVVGDRVTYTLPGTVSNSAPYNTLIINTAYYTHTTGNGQDSAEFLMSGSPYNLAITKTVTLPGARVLPGDLVTYNIVLANHGWLDAVDVVITDTLPVLLIGSDLDTTETIPVGEQKTFTITALVNASAPYEAQITNTAYFSHLSEAGQDSATFTLAPKPVDLSIAKSFSSAFPLIQVEDHITYTVIVTNSGWLTATGVVITDTLPTYIQGSDLDTTALITPDRSVKFEIPATVAAGTPIGEQITNTAYFTHTSGNGDYSVSFKVVQVQNVYLPLVTKNQ